MRFTCPSCKSSYRLSRDRLGPTGQARIKCPNCKSLARVKATDDKLVSTLLKPAGAVAQQRVAAPAARPRPSVTRATQPRTARPDAPSPTAAPATWHVAIGRKAEGPMAAGRLQEMLQRGRITADNLVWRKGQDGWKKLRDVSALAALLGASEPPPPPVSAVKTTLRTGAAGPVATAKPDDDEDERTVMQEVVSPEMLARTGPAARRRDAGTARPGDDKTMMADVVAVPGQGEAARKLAGRQVARRTGPARKARVPRRDRAPDQAATDAAEARTLKPGRITDGPGARLPIKAGRKAPRTTAGAAHEAARTASRRASGRAPAATAAATPHEAATGRRAAEAGAARDRAAGRRAVAGADMDGGGTDQRMAFFETGEQLNQDFELQMPDPDRHKPTKEEYQNLLQEFSVMFRLDKRSKRQKVLIGIVLTSLVVGVIAFGVILYVQGRQRQALLRDSKTILAVFELPYQQNADFDVTPDENVAEGSAIRNKKIVSILASQLLEKNKTRIVAARKKRTKSGAMATGGGGSYLFQKKYSKAERDALEARRKAAIAAALGGGYGGKREKVIRKNVLGTKKLSRGELGRLCSAKAADLRACGAAHAGGAAFKAKLYISTSGTVSKVTARVDGKTNVKLSACAEGKFARVRKPPQPEPLTFTCSVSGS